MNKFISYFLYLFILIFLTSCAAKNIPATFTQLPSVKASGDDAWEILLDTVSYYYPGIETADIATGEIRSIGIITDKCWAGILYGCFVPCKAEKFVAWVTSLSPFSVNIAVEKHKASSMSHYRSWYAAGNDVEKEKKIYQHLISNLNTTFKKPVVINNGKSLLVDMPTYSFTVEEFEGWEVKQRDPKLEKTCLTKTHNKVDYEIMIMKNLILDDNKQKENTSKLATEYIELELNNMREFGEGLNLYKLSDVIIRNEIIGKKKYFILDYKAKKYSSIQNNSMYLYFPHSDRNKYFIIVHYLELAPEEAKISDNYRENLKNILKSLSTK